MLLELPDRIRYQYHCYLNDNLDQVGFREWGILNIVYIRYFLQCCQRHFFDVL